MKQPLVERSIAFYRALSLQSSGEHSLMERIYAALNYLMLCHERTRLVRMTPSGVAMCEYLRPKSQERDNVEIYLPCYSRYFELVQPETRFHFGPVSGLSVIYHSDAPVVEKAVEFYHLPKDSQRAIADFLCYDYAHSWHLAMYNPVGTPVFCVGIQVERGRATPEFSPYPFHTCPTGRCRILKKSGKIQIDYCDPCLSGMLYLASFLSTGNKLSLGIFRQEVDAESDREAQRTLSQDAGVRKTPRPDKPHKLVETTTQLQYSVITFDASMKRSILKQGEHGRVQWLARSMEIDPNAVLRSPMSFSGIKRHLSGERWRAVIERTQRQKGQPIDLEAGIDIEIADFTRMVPRLRANAARKVIQRLTATHLPTGNAQLQSLPDSG